MTTLIAKFARAEKGIRFFFQLDILFDIVKDGFAPTTPSVDVIILNPITVEDILNEEVRVVKITSRQQEMMVNFPCAISTKNQKYGTDLLLPLAILKG